MSPHTCTAECWDAITRLGERLTPDCTSAAARLAVEGVAEDAVDGGWSFSGEKGWLLAPDQEERVRRLNRDVLARIDERQEKAGFPKCELCGARTRVLDDAGLCPRVTASHKEWREEARRVVSFR